MSPFLSPLILYKTEAQPDEVELQTITIARLYWLDYSFTSQCVSSGGKLIKNISFLFCRGERVKEVKSDNLNMLQKIISARF